MLLSTEIQLFPDITLFFQLAIFFVVLTSLNYLVFKPVLKILALRRSKIYGDKSKIEETRQKTTELMKEYETKIQKAKQEAFQLKESIRREGENEGQKIIQEARQASLAEIEKIKKEIEGARNVALKDLESHAEFLSQSIAEKVLGRPLKN